MSQLKSLPPWLQDDSVQPLNSPISKQQSSTPSDANYANANLTHSINNSNINQPTFNFPLEQSTKIQLMHWIMKVLLMALCVLMFVTAVIGIGESAF
jgi:ATP-dependent Zn protease